MKNIYLAAPVNKTAALVVNQSGCENKEGLESHRKSLALADQRLQGQIKLLPKKSKERKELGVKRLKIQNELGLLNKQIKLNNAMDRDLDLYIIEIIKSEMTKSKWFEVKCKAKQLREDRVDRFKADLNGK